MYQKIIVVGNVGRDPEMRYMGDGTAVTNFSVATNRRWTDRNGQQTDETTWFRVSVWGRQAETTNQYLARGSKVLVEGRLQPDPATGGPRIWTRQDGAAGASFEIRADAVRFLSSRDEMDAIRASGGGDAGGDPFDGGGATEEDDIPF